MPKKSLVEVFDIAPKGESIKSLKDYDIFPDKKLLDSLMSQPLKVNYLLKVLRKL